MAPGLGSYREAAWQRHTSYASGIGKTNEDETWGTPFGPGTPYYKLQILWLLDFQHLRSYSYRVCT